MHDKLVTVVVPVYNAECFLHKSIECLSGQTYSNIEVILVDDGSSDDSINILRQYKRLDSRLLIIRQTNQGAGAARNVGLRMARGEYVIFLDVDDYYDCSLIERLVSCADLNNADITICKSWAVSPNGKLSDMNFNNYLFANYDHKSVSPMDVKEVLLNSFLVEPWNKLYRKKFLLNNEIKFQTLKKTNDLFFTSITLLRANRISLVNEKLIYYRIDNRCKFIAEYEEKLLDHYKALLEVKNKIVRENTVFIHSFKKLAIRVIMYNLTLRMSHSIRNKLENFYVKEGLEDLGLDSDNTDDCYSWLEYIQLKLLKLRAPYVAQYCCYKLLKTVEYANYNGFKSVVHKIFN